MIYQIYLLLVASFVNASLLQQTPTSGNLETRAVTSGVTGCTCDYWYWYGHYTQNGRVLVNYPASNVLQDYATTGLGWCFQNGVMTAASQALITSAMTGGTNTLYVNVTSATNECSFLTTYFGQSLTTTAKCAAFIISSTTYGYSYTIGPNSITTTGFIGTSGTDSSLLASCSYPASNFIPTDCQCGFTCTNGYVQCGTSCINPSTQSCVSGVPHTTRRRSLSSSCPMGLTECNTGFKGGWECLNTTSSLESCGGCPFDDGVDCTAIDGAADVSCVSGSCVVDACEQNYQLENNECVSKLDSNPSKQFVF